MRLKRYHEALLIYESLEDKLSSCVSYNIRFCKKNLQSSFKENKKIEVPKLLLVRIIGNDLPDFHSPLQSYKNLKFILENEVVHAEVDTYYLINRIVSKEKRNQIKYLLNKYNKKYSEILFDVNEYLSIRNYYDDLPSGDYLKKNKIDDWDKLLIERSKRKSYNSYLMNNNGARNKALDIGLDLGYEWVAALDGNCFFSKSAIHDLYNDLLKYKDYKYFIIPMERCENNSTNLIDGIATDAIDEPQIVFNKKSKLRYCEDRVYGNQPKVDLLKRLSVPGIWDDWIMEYPWKKFNVCVDSSQKDLWRFSSFVYRLDSGNIVTVKNGRERQRLRVKAIIDFIDSVYDYCVKIVKYNSQTDYEYYRKSLGLNGETEDKNVKTRVNDVFDNVYLLSLEKDQERRLKVERQLFNLDIKYEWFKAVNGYEGDPLSIYNNYLRRGLGELSYFKEFSDLEKKHKKKFLESAGAIGYILSYIEIIKDAKNKGYRRILIVEDDVIFCHDFERRFNYFINSIVKDWKIIHLGVSQYGWKGVNSFLSLSQGFYQPSLHDTKGSFAIGLDESIYDELINNQKHFDAPFDHIPIGILYDRYKGKCFIPYPYLVMPDVSSSTIRGKRDQYQHANRVKWWVGDYDYPQKKVHLGLLLTSAKNIKYIKQNESLFIDAPFAVSFYFIHKNGIQPLHNLSIIEDDYNPDLEGNYLEGKSFLLDLFYKVNKDLFLTYENIINLIECHFSGSAIENGFSELSFNNEYKEGRVSVIIPTYKRPDNLRSSIESVLTQEYNDIELLIVDDNGEGSGFDKESSSIYQEIVRKYPNSLVKYIQHKYNSNGASARNTGILNSTGEYICFLDDDDIYLPGRLSKSIKALRVLSNETGAVYCGFYGWNSKELDINRFSSGDLRKNLLSLDYRSHYLHTNTATYKREAVCLINGFDISYRRHQDLEFNLRYFENYRIDTVKDCLVHLSPRKTEVDNKVYNQDFYNLKKRFLGQFKNIINSFDSEVRDEIYIKNWLEVIKYYKKSTDLIEYISKDKSNPASQILMLIDK